MSITLAVPPAGKSNYYKYVALLPTVDLDRSMLKKDMKEHFGVSLTGEVYEMPLHRQPVFERYANGVLPVAEDVCARHICLPVHSDMTEDEVDHVLTGAPRSRRRADRNRLKAMRIGVTGGTGFIGSHVVDRLADDGHEVCALDTRKPQQSTDFRDVDVLDLPSLIESTADLDVIFHLAGMSDVDFAYKDPVRTVRFNVDGTAKVVEAARLNDVRRVVFASTVWIYGSVFDTTVQPLTEAAPIALAKAGHIYTSTKVAGEIFLHSFAELYEVRFTILRYGMPYGPRMRDETGVRHLREEGAGRRAADCRR